MLCLRNRLYISTPFVDEKNVLAKPQNHLYNFRHAPIALTPTSSGCHSTGAIAGRPGSPAKARKGHTPVAPELPRHGRLSNGTGADQPFRDGCHHRPPARPRWPHDIVRDARRLIRWQIHVTRAPPGNPHTWHRSPDGAKASPSGGRATPAPRGSKPMLASEMNHAGISGCWQLEREAKEAA
jgi:hypothetical protein